MKSVLIFAILIGLFVPNNSNDIDYPDDPYIEYCEIDSYTVFLRKIINFFCSTDGYASNMFNNQSYTCCSYGGCNDKSKIDIIQLKNCLIPKFETNILKFYYNVYQFNMTNIGAESLQPEFFESGYNLKELDASHNSISEIPANVFSNCSLIEEINFSFNKISKIDNLAFVKNTALKKLNLKHNNLLSLSPSALLAQVQLIDLDLSFNPMEKLDPDSFADIFRKLTGFSMGGLQLENTVDILNALNPSIERLDISQNLLGPLNETTFKNFDQLGWLNISDTQLSNFEFGTFYHQRSLRSLDISYNHLGPLNFTLFFRHFVNLKLLNLEGNDLTEVDTVTKIVFPAIEIFGLSRNNFSCNYLANFLYQFPRVKLIYNPSNGPNIDGVDCYL